NIVASVDAGVKIRIDEARRNEAAPGVDLLVHRLGILLAGELDSIPFEDDDAVLEYLVLRAVKADDVTALDESSHSSSFLPVVSRSGPFEVMLNGARGIILGREARFLAEPGDIDAGVDVHRRLGRSQRSGSVAQVDFRLRERFANGGGQIPR